MGFVKIDLISLKLEVFFFLSNKCSIWYPKYTVMLNGYSQ